MSSTRVSSPPLSKRSLSSLNLLPVLIIPGFMSNGLEIEKSSLRSNWEGKDAWIDLPSLGFSNFCGDPEQQLRYKALWLEHMQLQQDMRSETLGVKVRPTSGSGSIGNLKEESFVKHEKYYFASLVDALEQAGYNHSTINLETAPYDWRLPPTHLEVRHSYFTETIQMIEDLYQRNKNTPIILLGHSLGAKVAHYLLNDAKLMKGQEWLNSRIYTFLPVSAPHLGAPKALRSLLSGDKMGLENFLSQQETLGLIRSFGSIPWLFPQQLPPGVPASAFIRPNGVLQMEFRFGLDPGTLIDDRRAICKPSKLQLVVSYGQNGDEKCPLITPFRRISEEGICSFGEMMTFATDFKPKTKGNVFQIALHEPGHTEVKTKERKRVVDMCITVLKVVTCFTIVEYIYKAFFRFFGDPTPSVVSAGHGKVLALSESIAIPNSVFKGKTALHKVVLRHKDDYENPEAPNPRTSILHVHVSWKAQNQKSSFEKELLCSAISEVTDLSPTLKVLRRSKKYEEISGHDMLRIEGLKHVFETMKQVYDCDHQLGPRTLSSIDAPPVRRVHAIYGINVPTEIGGIYERKDSCLDPAGTYSLYGLDTNATLSNSEYSVKNGILMETPKSKQVVAKNRRVCGDGVVPYWSLHHVETWKSSDREVTVVELENAEHNEIMKDSRFHEQLLAYCRREAQVLAKKRKFTTCDPKVFTEVDEPGGITSGFRTLIKPREEISSKTFESVPAKSDRTSEDMIIQDGVISPFVETLYAGLLERIQFDQRAVEASSETISRVWENTHQRVVEASSETISRVLETTIPTTGRAISASSTAMQTLFSQMIDSVISEEEPSRGTKYRRRKHSRKNRKKREERTLIEVMEEKEEPTENRAPIESEGKEDRHVPVQSAERPMDEPIIKIPQPVQDFVDDIWF